MQSTWQGEQRPGHKAPRLRRVQQVARGGAVRGVLVRPDHALREARAEQLRAGARRGVHPVPGTSMEVQPGFLT